MSKKLVAYFSASKVTEKVANKIAEAAGADIYEIKPEIPYTTADLNWMDKKSRSSVEMSDKTIRPAIADKDANVEAYDEIILGFPIWWYVAPTIINTPEQAKKYAGMADGVIVGSAIVKIIEKYGENAAEPVYNYVKEMADAVK